ncbi:MAG: hypothetical protein JO100_16145 [Pseudonocardia sp.]|nr:hypothetical protein [Pseudonocardia sp.]
MSASLVSQVERGVVPASAGFVAAAAGTLGVTVAELWNQPPAIYGSERQHIGELETAVMEGPDSIAHDRPLSPIDVLATALEQVAVLQRRSRYQQASAILPELLRQLHVAAAAAPAGCAGERAHELLAKAYSCALYCLHRLGSPVTGQAAERGASVAALSGDPLLAAFSQAGRAVPLLYRGSYAVADRIINQARAAAETEEPRPSALAVRGSMHLQSAIVAARRGDSQLADSHLAEAADLARHVPELGPDADYYDTGFSATNVGFHAVAAAVEVGDGTLAISRGAALDIPETVMRSRRGHHHIDTAGAWMLHGNRDQALSHLQRARQLTPEQTRYHPQAREIVAAIAETDRRRTASLTNLSRWVGIATT